MDDPVDTERLLRLRAGGVTDLRFPAPPARTSPSSGLPRGGAGRGGILASTGRFGDLDLDFDIERSRPRPRRSEGGVAERSRREGRGGLPECGRLLRDGGDRDRDREGE